MREVYIPLNPEKLKGKSLFVATPMYGGQCTGAYMYSCLQLQQECQKYGVPFRFYALYNESLVTRARNYCADTFLRSEFTHMLFIDSDIHFNPVDALKMLAYDDKDIICGPYTKKNIRWDRVLGAYNRNLFSDPESAEDFGGDFAFNAAPETKNIVLSEPCEVMESATGFMLIKRETFETYASHYPELAFETDHPESCEWKDKEMIAYFDTVIDPKTKRYLSEDFMFCQYARKAGLKVWLCPWVKLQHIGNYTYKGDFISTLTLISKD